VAPAQSLKPQGKFKPQSQFFIDSSPADLAQGETRFGDLFMFKTSSGKVLAFHPRNLQLAELDHTLGTSELLSSLEAWEGQQDPEVKDAGANGVSLVLNVTQICNLACKYCFAGGDGTYGDPVAKISIDQTLPSLREMATKVSSSEVFRVHFIGGEPLLYPEGIGLICSYLKDLAQVRGFTAKFHLTTNGTLLTEANIALLARWGISVSVSMDGPPEVMDRVKPSRTGQPLGKQIEEGILRVAQYRKNNPGHIPSLSVGAVFNQENFAVWEAWNYFRQLPVDLIRLGLDFYQYDQMGAVYLSDLQRVVKAAIEIGGEAELLRIAEFKDYFYKLDHQIRVNHFCGAGVNLFAQDARQNLYLCPSMVGHEKAKIGKLGRIENDSVLAPIRSSELSLIKANDCGSCWARSICGGGCMFIHEASTGNKHKKSYGFCSIKKGSLKIALEAYRHLREEQAPMEEAAI
jgi:uncharacterized protein